MYTHKTGQKISDGFLMGPLANGRAKSHFFGNPSLKENSTETH